MCLLAAARLGAQDPSVYNGPMTMTGPINFCGQDTGTSNAYVCANTTVSVRQIKALVRGNTYRFQATHTNTSSATLAIDGMTPVAIKKWQGGSLVDVAAGDITSGQPIAVTYDGTYLEMPAGSGSGLPDPGANGLVKRTGPTTTTSAVAGTDYQAPISAGTGASNYAAGNDVRFKSTSQRVVYMSRIVSPSDTQVIGSPGAYTSYGTDEASTINAALAGGNVHLYLDGDYSVCAAAISMPSNTTLTVLGKLVEASGCNLSAIIINANPSTPTTASGTGGYLPSNITDSNIIVDGQGIIDLNSQASATGTIHKANPAGTWLFGLWFRGVQHLLVKDVTVNDAPTYGVFISNSIDAIADHVRVIALASTISAESKNTDGVHFTGPAYYPRVLNCYFQTGDDGIDFAADNGFRPGDNPGVSGFPDSLYPNMRWGPIVNPIADNNYFDGAVGGVRFESQSERISDAFVLRSAGTVRFQFVSMYNFNPSNGPGNIGTLTIRDFGIKVITGNPFGSSDSLIQCALKTDVIKIQDGKDDDFSVQSVPFLSHSTAAIGALNLSRVALNNGGGASIPIMVRTGTSGGTIATMVMTDVNFVGQGGTLLGGTAAPTTLKITGYVGDKTKILPARPTPGSAGYIPTFMSGDGLQPLLSAPVHYSTLTTWAGSVDPSSGNGSGNQYFGDDGDWLIDGMWDYYASFASTNSIQVDMSCTPHGPLPASGTIYQGCGLWAYDSTNHYLYQFIIQVPLSTVAGSAVLTEQRCDYTGAASYPSSCAVVSGTSSYAIATTRHMYLEISVSGGNLLFYLSDNNVNFWQVYSVGVGTIGNVGFISSGSHATVHSLEVH